MIHGEPSFGGSQMIRRGLCDDQFARVENLLPGRPGYVGRDSELGNRLFVDAVIWKFRTGVLGATCRRASAPGRTSTRDSHAGRSKGFGRVFSRRWPMIPTTSTP